MNKEIFFKCHLKSHVILNASLATEGNMESLDYIPGSNFMGIVANHLYKHHPNLVVDYIHNGKVRYGDAYISDGEAMSLPIPLIVYTNKLDPDMEKNAKYFHHLLNSTNLPKQGNRLLQLQQKRGGYFNLSGSYWNVIDKSFALKSAYDSQNRRSMDGAMYGFESIVKGQDFVFSVEIEDKLDEKYIIKALVGEQKIGKSKSAEYGWVEITKLPEVEKPKTLTDKREYALVYSQSNLCFYDENGYPTLQPKAKDLGFSEGTINWEKSQIRTYSYSPWNAYRNVVGSQRNCIVKGSVFYVENPAYSGDGYEVVGEYLNEGLGRVIINPEFLFKTKQNGIEWDINLKRFIPQENIIENGVGNLSAFLTKKRDEHQKELVIARKVFEYVEKEKTEKKFQIVSNSQWGNIRHFATIHRHWSTLEKELFADKTGVLLHGVSYENCWGKKNEFALKQFRKIFDDNKDLGHIFIAKLAAEMAKIEYK